MSPFTRLYYTVKPLLPDSVRNALRRAHARRARTRSWHNWPIQRGSEHPPQGWTGWPHGKKFAVVLTHDVEGQRGYDRIHQLAAVERELGFRSSFNLIPEGPYRVSPQLRAQLANEGFEVGIHDLHHDGKLYRSHEEFSRRARRINRYVKEWGVSGFRSAYMHHNLEWLGELDVAYDASTFDTDPFEPQPDGVGTIFPFWVPRPPSSSLSSSSSDESAIRNPQSAIESPSRDSLPLSAFGSPLSKEGFVELPYTLVQDSTIFLFLGDKNIDCWKKKVDWIARHGGMVLVNVHPDYLNYQNRFGEHSFPVSLYRELLTYVKENYADQYWHALPREVASFVKEMRPRHETRRSRRICMLSHSYYESDGRIIRYAETLAARGDEVDAIALRNPQLPPRSSHNGVQVIRLLTRDYSVVHNQWAQLIQLLRFCLAANWRLTLSCLGRPYDLVHIHNIPDFLVFAAWLHKLLGRRVILDIHDVVPELYLNKFQLAANAGAAEMLRIAERASCAFSDHVIIANHLWFDMVTSRSVPSARCSPFINNVDTSLFYRRPRARDHSRQVMIFPGSLQWHQGLDIALEAMALLRDELPRLDFHIYGNGAAIGGLRKQIERLGLQERVKLLGGRPLGEIAELIANADLGVVPKRSDSFGNEAYSTKIMEFMAMGIPAVVSRTKIDDFYFNDDVVSFFEPQNPADLARAIKRVLQDQSYRERLVANALNYVEANCWGTVQKQYLDLVDRLLAA